MRTNSHIRVIGGLDPAIQVRCQASGSNPGMSSEHNGFLSASFGIEPGMTCKVVDRLSTSNVLSGNILHCQ